MQEHPNTNTLFLLTCLSIVIPLLSFISLFLGYIYTREAKELGLDTGGTLKTCYVFSGIQSAVNLIGGSLLALVVISLV